jgi:hypothetical protein
MQEKSGELSGLVVSCFQEIFFDCIFDGFVSIRKVFERFSLSGLWWNQVVVNIAFLYFNFFFKYSCPISHRILNKKKIKKIKNSQPKVINCHLIGDFCLANFKFKTRWEIGFQGLLHIYGSMTFDSVTYPLSYLSFSIQFSFSKHHFCFILISKCHYISLSWN